MTKKKKTLVYFEDCQNCSELLFCLPFGNNKSISKNNCIFREEVY